MKILFLVEDYLPTVCGMSIVSKNIAQRFVQHGYDVSVFTSKRQFARKEIIDGVKIRRFDIIGNYVAGFEGGDVELFKRSLRGESFDWVFIWAAQQWTCDLFILNQENLKNKIVFIPTGFSGLNNKKFTSYYDYLMKISGKIDATVFLSKEYKDYKFYSQHVNNSYVIPNGVDLNEFKNNFNKDALSRLGVLNKNVILHVGNYTGAKGQFHAVKIFEKSDLPNDWVLVLNGREKEVSCRLTAKIKRRLKGSLSFQEIKEYIIKKKLSKRVILTDLPRRDLTSLFNYSKIFLFPSFIECSPLVVFEAMASKTAFLSTDVGNCREISDETKAGQLIKTKFNYKNEVIPNVVDGASKLSNLVHNPLTCKRMGQNGYLGVVNKYNWDAVFVEYLSIIEEKGEKNSNY